jgi:hypothetical protein
MVYDFFLSFVFCVFALSISFRRKKKQKKKSTRTKLEQYVLLFMTPKSILLLPIS